MGERPHGDHLISQPIIAARAEVVHPWKRVELDLLLMNDVVHEI
jgi:hypothetical protein